MSVFLISLWTFKIQIPIFWPHPPLIPQSSPHLADDEGTKGEDHTWEDFVHLKWKCWCAYSRMRLCLIAKLPEKWSFGVVLEEEEMGFVKVCLVSATICFSRVSFSKVWKISKFTDHYTVRKKYIWLKKPLIIIFPHLL